jgi:hypothetical protein
MILPGKCLGASLQMCFLHYWVLSPSVQPHDLTRSICRHISATLYPAVLIAVSKCTTSWPYPVYLQAHLCKCVSYVNICCLPVYNLMTLTGESLGTSLKLCFLHYWLLSPSVQRYDLNQSISRHISATVFLTILSAVSQCTTSWTFPVNL